MNERRKKRRPKLSFQGGGWGEMQERPNGKREKKKGHRIRDSLKNGGLSHTTRS